MNEVYLGRGLKNGAKGIKFVSKYSVDKVDAGCVFYAACVTLQNEG